MWMWMWMSTASPAFFCPAFTPCWDATLLQANPRQRAHYWLLLLRLVTQCQHKLCA
jgi:hypothetical protein